MGFWETNNSVRYADAVDGWLDEKVTEFKSLFPEADRYQFLNTVIFCAGRLTPELTSR